MSVFPGRAQSATWLAVRKHINAKTAGCGAAGQSLLLAHDEFTKKPVLDETGRLIMIWAQAPYLEPAALWDGTSSGGLSMGKDVVGEESDCILCHFIV